MEKKRKRPNFIDIGFIALIAAVALTAYLLSHREAADVTVPTVTRSYTIELASLDPSVAECFAVGDPVTDNIKNLAIGTVTAIESVPATSSATDEEAGIIRQAEIPDRVTLYVTIEAATTETQSQIATTSGFTLRVGSPVSCVIGSMRATGYIVGLQR